MNAATLFQTAL